MTPTELAQFESQLRTYDRAGLGRGLRLLGTLGAIMGVGMFTLTHLRWGSPAFLIAAGLMVGGLLDLAVYVLRTTKRFDNEVAVLCPSCGHSVVSEVRATLREARHQPQSAELLQVTCHRCGHAARSSGLTRA